MAESKLGICDCCFILRRDSSMKTVSYCNSCHKWFCKSCENSPERLVAASKYWGDKFLKAIGLEA